MSGGLNLLMYDHQTQSLWQQMTGEPVVGRLAQSNLRLKVLPVVMAPWREWRAAHPDTLILDNKTGQAGDSALGGPYAQSPANAEAMFPIHPRDDRLQANARSPPPADDIKVCPPRKRACAACPTSVIPSVCRRGGSLPEAPIHQLAWLPWVCYVPPTAPSAGCPRSLRIQRRHPGVVTWQSAA